MADIVTTKAKTSRQWHSMQVKLPDDEWRRFRAVCAFRKIEVGTIVGGIISEWLKETAQRTLISGLDS